MAQLPELQGQGVRAPGQWLPPACYGGSPEASAWPLLCHAAQPSSRNKTQGSNSEGRNGAGIGPSTSCSQLLKAEQITALNNSDP